MRRPDIPLMVGMAGLLVLQLGCAESPTAPAGAPEREQYLGVVVRNAAGSPATLSLDINGFELTLGALEDGASETYRVTAPALMSGGPVWLVAVAVAAAGRLETEPLEVRAGWLVEIWLTPAGPAVSAHPAAEEDASPR